MGKGFSINMRFNALLLILALSVSAVCTEDDFFPPLADSSDISYFFANEYDIDGLHWALTNIFNRSSRNPDVTKNLPQELVARGGGDTYTSEYKLRHDLEQAKYLVKYLKSKKRSERAAYFESKVIPIYEKVLNNIPSLDKLERTKGLYAFTNDDYSIGISEVYNKALFMTSSDVLDSKWRERRLLNEELNFNAIQQDYSATGSLAYSESTAIPGVVVIDNLLSPETLALIRQLLLTNTHWYQTKTPLEFGKYVGAYIDDVSSSFV